MHDSDAQFATDRRVNLLREWAIYEPAKGGAANAALW